MKICDLLSGINFNYFGNVNKKIMHLNFNSKLFKKNSLFFCLNGTKTNAIIYIDEAIKNGAVAVVLGYKNYKEYLSLKNKNINKRDRVKIKTNNRKMKISNSNQNLKNDVLFIFVRDVRKAMAKISANFFDNPQKKLKIIGITGTNGKTSCSYLIANLLKSFGEKVGIIGTNGVFIGNEKINAHMTTPDSIELFEIFSKMVNAKIEYCVMEVSAHAIFLNKTFGINFNVKCLTNVKTDHLDFFKSQENYEKTKLNFFRSKDNVIVNYDDKIGKNIVKKCKKSIYFGQKSDNFIIFDKSLKIGDTKFKLKIDNNIYSVETKLTGEFNIYNITLSMCVLLKLGFNIKDILDKVKLIDYIEGRFDVVHQNQNYNIIIDYAHTIDSLKNLLVTTSTLSSNKNIIVFGCPGERDTTKRFLMGQVASNFCEYVVLTTDNPASENAKRIMFEIGEGVKSTHKEIKCFYIENREKAIKKAIKIANIDKNCNVLIVGKGVENYQIIGENLIKYSDYDVVKRVISNNQ